MLNRWVKLTAAFAAVWVASWAGRAAAHPLSQGALEVNARTDRVDVRARVTIEEVIITDMLTSPAPAEGAKPRPIEETYAKHADYLAQHVQIFADGVLLKGRVATVTGPATQPSSESQGPDREHVVYELMYTRESAEPLTGTRRLEFRQDVLVGVEFAPGVTWEASYAVRARTGDGPATEGLLLTSAKPAEYAPEWPGSATAAKSANAANGAGLETAGARIRIHRSRLARDYIAHGVHHILTGYDHLLFISALVLAAVGVWDLVKVVSAFTLAHTITLTLAALRLVHVPTWIIEPMIAASIVFVAVQNVFWPRQTRGWTRLALAFGFGLFHGLGFAGGLLDAMQEMSGLTIVLAIAAFSLGVELGHQMIVLPLFGVLKLARQTRAELVDRDRVSLTALRYGSALICLAGLYYLVAAVGAAVAVRT